MIQLYSPQKSDRSPLRNISHTADRTGNRYELVDVSFLVVRGDTNQNNERITNNHSHI
ncbi:hypothetical protein [Nostoc sp.]|uniref:hypothetical protein n=1 Tax=Nostoc sp. TaxID=1180 RepID=UPI002FF83A59